MLKVISVKELYSKDFPEDEWLVKPLVPRAGITIFSGHPGNGKTWLLVDLARAVSQGDDLFDSLPTVQGKVLYIDEENGEALMKKRMIQLGIVEDDQIYLASHNGIKMTKAIVNEIIHFCEEKGVETVIIDSLVRVHHSDENDASGMARVFEQLKKFNVHNITVILSHHNRKGIRGVQSSGQDMRGSGDILAAIDSHLEVSKEDAQITVTQHKLRQDIESPPFDLTLQRANEEYSIIMTGYRRTASDKKREIDGIILDLIDGSFMSQIEILASLKQHNIPVGERTLRTRLNRFISEDKIGFKNSVGNTKLYYKNNAEDEK